MVERRCIASKEIKPAEELIRFVCGPDGMAVPDLALKLPGRGCWLSLSADAVQTACQKGLFMRHISAKADNSDAMLSQLAHLLAKRVQQSLALARRAGIAIGGGGKLAGQETAVGMLIANDASPREAKAHIRRLSPDWVFDDFASDYLGQPFGRESLAYIGILPDNKSTLAEQLKTDITRFRPFMAAMACQEGAAGCITPSNTKR